MVMKDIENINDIQLLVDSFYSKIRNDEQLGSIFNGIIQDRWPQHLEKMYRFWQTILLDDQTYFGSPFVPHAKMPVDKSHFEQWIKLFSETVDENFAGEKAEQAKWQGQRMADMFHYKIEYIKNSSTTPL